MQYLTFVLTLSVATFESGAAIIYLENAADGGDSMSLAPGESADINIVLEVAGNDTLDFAYLNSFNDDDDNANDSETDVTAVLAGLSGPDVIYDRSAFVLPSDISWDISGDEYGLIMGRVDGEGWGPGTYIVDTITVKHAGVSTSGTIPVTFELGARAPQLFSSDFVQYPLAPPGFPPGFSNFIYVGDDGSNNPPLIINLVEGSGVCDGATGDCCTVGGNGTPGCDNLDCCEAICADDSFCCDTAWDSDCANVANAECDVCLGGGGVVEGASSSACEQKLLPGDGGSGDDIGFAVAISDDRLVLGSPDDDEKGTDAGAVYVFRREGTDWVEEAKLTASDAVAFDSFGESVDISGNYLVVGAPMDDGDAGNNAGSAYVFERQGPNWVERAKLEAIGEDGNPDGGSSDEFGKTVSIDEDTVVLGAPFDDDIGSNSGSVYVFVRDGQDWVPHFKLVPDDGAADDQFGLAIAVSGSTIAVAAPLDDDQGSNAGKVYVFALEGDEWVEQEQLSPNEVDAGDQFGLAVSLSGESLAVGAPFDDDSGLTNSGSVYVFVRSDAVWSLEEQLTSEDASSNDEFGRAVSIHHEWLVVGAPEDDDVASGSGSAYVFRREGTFWTQLAKPTASDAGSSDSFGQSVSADDLYVLAGAPEEDQLGSNAGSAYIYRLDGVLNLSQGKTYPTIQAAINDANDGDEIEATACTFFENLDFMGKDILVRSTDPIDPDVVGATIIDGRQRDTTVSMNSGEIRGFTIVNGSAFDENGDDAGGVDASGSAIVSFNVIADNHCEKRGGGVIARNSVIVHNNVIQNNTTDQRAGGIDGRDNSILASNLITGNFAPIAAGGVRARESTLVRNNTIIANSTLGEGGGDIVGGGGIIAENSSVIVNNLIVFSTTGSGINVIPGSTVTADYNCVFGNEDGDYEGSAAPGPNDINEDPFLESDDVHLGLLSPCVHAGDPETVVLEFEKDYDGLVRIDGGRVDIGADEARDCNGNAILDSIDVFTGISEDLDSNGIPDECQEDCNGDATLDPADCNENFVLDECEVFEGTVSDCNNNGVPDECEEDCNESAAPDDCDIADGTSEDCNGNGVPDECDVGTELSADCNFNFIPDECEVAAGSSSDCNVNEVLDACELYESILFEVDSGELGPIGDGTPQTFVIEAAPVALDDVVMTFSAFADLVSAAETIDVELNGEFLATLFAETGNDCPEEPDVTVLVLSAETFNSAVDGGDAEIEMVASANVDPNLCDPVGSFIEVTVEYDVEGQGQDCNENVFPDECDITDGTSQDCDLNGVPDECEEDCNDNGIGDACDIVDGTSQDCNANSVPDECEEDCNENGIADECDLTDGTSLDCNANAIPDECPPDSLFEASSENLAPFDANVEQTFSLTFPPEAQGNVTFTFTAEGDLDESDVEFVVVEINGMEVGTVFLDEGNSCGSGSATDVLVIPSSDYNDALSGGNANLRMLASDDVGPCGSSFIQVDISYERLDEGDCDGDGILDACDIEDGLTPDCNSNFIPDVCDLNTGFSKDCNLNDVPDECDIEPTAPGITIRGDLPPVAEFIDISTTGTPLNLADDQVKEFTMPFVTSVFPSDSVQISNNGALGFDGILSLSSINEPLPTEDAFGGVQALFPYWDDLSADVGNVYVDTVCDEPICGEPFCVSPYRIFVVQWNDRPHYPGSSGDGGGEEEDDTVTFQVQIFETPVNNVVAQFLYEDTDFLDPTLDDGASATIGYQQDSTDGAPWSFNEAGAVDPDIVLSIIAPSTSVDRNDNGRPDECETPGVTNLTQEIKYIRIQDAIDAALDGDEIEVARGTYAENLDFLGKTIVVRSADPLNERVRRSTVIDGQCKATVVTMSTGVLSGFTIQNGGDSGENAGGVHATGDAVVSFNQILGNTANNEGGGVGAFDQALVYNNLIRQNTAFKSGGGVNARDQALVIDNIITQNFAVTAGAGVWARDDAVIRNNTITENSTPGSDDGPGTLEGGGGIAADHHAMILSNIIAFAADGSGLNVEGTNVINAFNCVFGNANGNYEGDAEPGEGDISTDPFLINHYSLHDNSPCIARGDPDLIPLPDELDTDGEPRVSGDRVDIGADEAADCNSNGRGDATDIEIGISEDVNENGIPDECELPSDLCDGDANGDGIVDPLDVGFVLARFGCLVGTGDANCDAADQNDDEVVDPLDVGYVLSRFGECP